MKILLLLIALSLFSYAKKDFYYSFIDSSGQQIQEDKKNELLEGYATLENIRRIAKEATLDEAYKRLKTFKDRNKVKLLESDIILLESEFLLKKGLKRFVIEGAKYLEDAINRSAIHEEDQAKAYMILIELKLASNKPNDAKYFIDILTNNFDTPIIKAYGKIYLAKLHIYKDELKKATIVLYDLLTKTTDINIATVVADELFDVYILDDKREEAYALAEQVLNKNIDYYANDSFLAVTKVDKLVKNGMPNFAATILEELLKRTKNIDAIEDFKFKLAETYMLMYDGTMKNLFKAKEFYKDIINDYPDGKYAKRAKMIIDEILMREGKVEPAIVNSKYFESASMQQKVIMQEMLNAIKEEKYEYVLRSEKVYKKIAPEIYERFGYKNLNDVLDGVRILLIKQYLMNGKCKDLNEALKRSTKEAILRLVQDEYSKYKFFECLIEVPYEEGYITANEALYNTRDPKTYLYLERIAFALGHVDEALKYSAKLEMLNDKQTLEEEFLYRFKILNTEQNPISMKRFFNYATKNPDFIQTNQTNPMIIDFYYQYYFYLLQLGQKEEAKIILDKLYNKQKEFKAQIYSPLVELELAKYEKSQGNYAKALRYLEESLTTPRNIKNNELAQLFYEMIKLYELTKNQPKYDEVLKKCKALDSSTTSLYKKMCDEL